jgi:site-specific DNA recombinase
VSPGRPRRAGIYARISPTPGEGAGWQRQLADCRELVAQRGWEVVGEYVDKDTSAYRRRKRPEWERLLADLEAGVVDALVVYHPDRAYRRGEALERLIDIVERLKVEVATVRAGDLDLGSATGRMGARIVAAVSQHESERMGERVARAKKERAAQGRPSGGGVRAFGWGPDKVTPVPEEARALKAAGERVAAGGSIGAEARKLNMQGFTTTGGRAWDTKSLRRVLTSPRIAGLRSYRGEVVGKAAWEPIVSEDVWRRIVVMTEGRRTGDRPAPRVLLSSLIECHKCGGRLYVSQQPSGYLAYVCAPATRQGCGGASVAARAADARVSRWVEDQLAHPPAGLGRWLKGHDQRSDDAELHAIQERRVAVAQRWAAGKMDDAAYDAAIETLDQRAAELDREVRPSLPLPMLSDVWKRGTVAERRELVSVLVRVPIGLKPGRMADPGDRLIINPAWD